jgi:hypothetical protein
LSQKNKWLNDLVEDVVKDVSKKINSNSIKNEAYVVQSRPVKSSTETLSDENKKNHQELLEGYVKSLNEISAKLDSVDRESVTPNGRLCL